MTDNFPRVLGYDIARSAALLGMILVHFALVAGSEAAGPAWMTSFLSLLDGRAAATFVILAGIGITMMSRRAVASGDAAKIAEVRTTLIRRGIFLLIVGFVNLTIWPGDILRVYGVSLILASQWLTASGKRLLGAAAALAVAFTFLVLAADFEKNWDWETLTYRNLWTLEGVFRNLFYDGFRSVLPWTGFIFYGMWLGRFDLADWRIGRLALTAALATLASAELFSHLLVSTLTADPPDGLDVETIRALFGTESMPALPLFLLAAGATATTVITLCVQAAARWPSRAWQPLIATGQMSLTWYFAHIVVGLGMLVALEIVGTETQLIAALYGLIFFTCAVFISWVWKSRFQHGPLEWLMRKCCQ
jgi:uncharacterized protein